MSDHAALTSDSLPAGALTGLNEVSVEPSPAASTDVIDQELPDQAIYSRSYVEDVRREAAKYRSEAAEQRQRAAAYDDVFGRYEPQDQQVWFDLARTWETDPARAAGIMQQIANGVLGEMNGQQQPAVEREPEYVDDEGLTAEKVQALIDAQFQSREQAAIEQRAVDNVMAEVRTAGFDPDSAEGFMVLWNANHETNGDITKAAEMVRGYRQSVIDDYVQGRTSGRTALPTSGGVQATAAPAPITNLEDARRATEAFLKERRGA
jgi:hypothetical protein